MKKTTLILLSFLLTASVFAADEKQDRHFKDQPDIIDGHQIHFIYLLGKDSKDKELDINGQLQKEVEKANEVMFERTSKNKGSKGIGKKYTFDYRKDGKLDITFIRTDLTKKELSKYSTNTQIANYLVNNGYNNKKKTYFNFTDVSSKNSGDAGVGIGTLYLGTVKKQDMTVIILHELLHTQLMGIKCIKGIKTIHWFDHDNKHMLGQGTNLNKNLYTHNIEGCPQLIDSIYLTPTSKDPYSPYEIMCERNLGKYTHPKLVKIMAKAKKKNKWYSNRIGPTCNWRDWTGKFAKSGEKFGFFGEMK
tara:strand:- start:698 stop:1612 length:915 start_codon:yes stop_codon:yes gene_type:complete